MKKERLKRSFSSKHQIDYNYSLSVWKIIVQKLSRICVVIMCTYSNCKHDEWNTYLTKCQVFHLLQILLTLLTLSHTWTGLTTKPHDITNIKTNKNLRNKFTTMQTLFLEPLTSRASYNLSQKSLNTAILPAISRTIFVFLGESRIPLY